MSVYNNFIGIDIGKNEFYAAVHGFKHINVFSNDQTGLNKFVTTLNSSIDKSFIVLEATGGYEQLALSFLAHQGFKVHRADARKVKNFIRSFKQYGKTDKLDAKAIAYYGYERSNVLEPYQAKSQIQMELSQLYERRTELTKILVQEKNRLQGPSSNYIRQDLAHSIEDISRRISSIDESINQLIAGSEEYKEKKQVLIEIPGIGEKVANAILATLPEIGLITGKQMASLCGLAPHPYQSGKSEGYRKTCGGRRVIKPTIFLAAMAARRSKSRLAEFYNRLVEKGKKKMVAIVAVMRKIMVIANAKIRDLLKSEVLNQHS